MPEVTQLVRREAGLQTWSSGARVQAFNHHPASPARWAELELCVVLGQLTFQQRRQGKEVITKHVMPDEAGVGRAQPRESI